MIDFAEAMEKSSRLYIHLFLIMNTLFDIVVYKSSFHTSIVRKEMHHNGNVLLHSLVMLPKGGM